MSHLDELNDQLSGETPEDGGYTGKWTRSIWLKI